MAIRCNSDNCSQLQGKGFKSVALCVIAINEITEATNYDYYEEACFCGIYDCVFWSSLLPFRIKPLLAISWRKSKQESKQRGAASCLLASFAIRT
jgi:hypothetical protein